MRTIILKLNLQVSKKIFNKIYIMGIMMVFSILISTSQAQVNYQINKIKFQGNKTFRKKVLVENISIYERTFLEKLFRRKEPAFYNETMIQADVERLIRFYQSQGFLYVNVELLPPDINEEKHHVDVTFNIREDDPILVDSISQKILETNPKLNEDSIKRRIERRFELEKNKRFTDAKLAADVANTNFAFRSTGYPYVETKYSLDIRPEQRKTDVHFTTDPGPRSRFDTTHVTGNRYLTREFIKKQLKYKKGEIFSEKKIDNTRRNLYDLQVFRIVSISPQINNATRDSVIPIHITIKEQPRLSTEFGVGYGTEEKFRAYTRITYRSLFGGARRLELYGRHSGIEPYNITLSFVEPRFILPQLSLNSSPYFRRQIEPGFDTQTLGVNVPLNYKFNDNFNATLTYYFQRVSQRLHEGFTDVPSPESNKFLYNKSGLMSALSYTTALPRTSPTEGYSLSLGSKFNGYIFGGDFSYIKLWFDARKYQSLGNEFVLAGRGMIGGIYSSDESKFIPVEDRFYSGGSNSIRGWGRSLLGPMWENGKPRGGKSILELNLELRRPLFWILEGAVFVDAGNVWENAFSYKLNDWAYAVGGGLRFSTPIGPIRLDIGFPVKSDKRNPQFFINVGQAF